MTTFAVYLVLDNRYTIALKSSNISIIMSHKSIDFIPVNISIINQTNNSIFQSGVSNYYPNLPLYIFTQSLSLIGNRSKLILLGNTFFGDPTWRFFVPRNASTKTSRNY